MSEEEYPRRLRYTCEIETRLRNGVDFLFDAQEDREVCNASRMSSALNGGYEADIPRCSHCAKRGDVLQLNSCT